VGVLAVGVPVQAHFTLGNLSGTNPYDFNNFDPHVAGPIGYVWPGSGQCAWDGFPNQASDNCSPGYQSPYPNGNPPGAPSNSWYQLQGDTYAPFGAVLTNSTGDLVFALNATCRPSQWATGCTAAPNHEIQAPLLNRLGWDTWIILIPPEFTVPGSSYLDSSQIVSTLSNSYNRYLVAKLSPNDRYAPNWTLVAITADATIDTSGPPAGLSSIYYDHQYIQFTNAGEWYYVRINGVTAPSVAGRYFFKMALYSTNFLLNAAAFSGLTFYGNSILGVGPTLAGPNVGLHENPTVWVPPQNWPVMLVKGETDPAIVTGTLRYAGYNATLYQQPIAEAGKVWAHMTMRLDPYTGQQRPDLATIDGQAFVNATANGHYELEGLAPGVYDIYAEAAGYPQTLCTSGITVLKGQSLHFDCYLQPGPVIHGNVFTKHQFGDEPWPGNSTTGQYMKIELYSNPTLSNLVDPSAGPPVSWSPLPCVAGGQEDYQSAGAAGLCGDPRDASAIAFPWHEYAPNTLNTAYAEADTPFQGTTNGYSRDVAISGGCAPAFIILGFCSFPYGSGGSTYGLNNLLASDPEGVGPPQHWFVAGGTTTPFHFEFGLKGEYGAPRDLSGEVPQVYATWINGLTPGRYYVRAWTFRYVQTALDGATFQEYYFDITPNEWAGDVTLPIDLRLSSWVNKTVYFHDTPNTIETNPIHSGAGYLWGVLVGSDGHVYSANVTGLGLLEQNTTGINPACFSGVGGYLSSCYSTTPLGKSNGLTTGESVHPTYYYNTVSFASLPNFNACYSYDEYSIGLVSAARGIFASAFPASTGTPAVPLNGEFGAPSQICPFPTGNGREVSALDKAGLNANSLATGEATIQFWGINDTWGGENYGIPSGTYTPNVATNGYYSPSPAEQVSVTLSGNPTSVSDHLFLGPGFNVSIYSIDWERPRVSRPWVWSGCQTIAIACVGSEIDLGFYPVVNGTGGTLADFFGASISAMPPSVPLTTFPLSSGGRVDMGGLFQGPAGTDCVNPNQGFAFECAEMDGGGRNVLPGYELSHFVFYGSSAAVAFVGGSTSGIGYITAGRGTWRAGGVFLRVSKFLTDTMWLFPGLTWPLHFNEGQYNLAADTYGYIQDKDFSAYAMNGQTADMKINLIIGVNITLDVLFKKESIITGTPYNMSARVRVFNDQSQLVAEWMSSEGTYVDRTGHAIAANGQLPPGGNAFGVTPATFDFPLYPFNTQLVVRPASGLNGYDYLPGGTNLLHVLMAGLPQESAYGGTISGGYFSDPIFTPAGCTFELDCPNPPYPSYGQYPFPYTGIAGAPDYTGGWTAEVDFVPWYANNTVSTVCSLSPIPPVIERNSFSTMPVFSIGQEFSDPQQVFSCPPNSIGAQYYPPVNGLLMGESYHIIPGTTALSGISLTEDSALGFLKHSMAPNHLGPYSQEGVWQIAGTHNSGEASAIFEVDLNGFVSGNVLAFTWSNEFRTLSWGTISVTGASGGATWNFYTYDGIYQAYMPTGNYKFTIAQSGYAPQTWAVSVSPGQVGTGQNVYLEQSNIPVPEFSTAAIVAFSALAASVYLLKRRRK